MVTNIYTACHPERRLSDPAERESEAAVEEPVLSEAEGIPRMFTQPMLHQGVFLENSLARVC
jgi:hypothetical protein